MEVSLKQQLSEEYEQVSAVVSLKFLTRHRATINFNRVCVFVCLFVAHVGNIQAQRTILELQAHLDLLKDSESQQADTEDVAQLKVGQYCSLLQL